MSRTVKADSLEFRDLVHINPRNGIITLNNRRMILISVEAMGILRRDLVSTLGMDRAKGFLMRYGWANGYKDGEAIEKMFPWESRRELLLSGPALHTSEGIVTVETEVLEMTENSIYFAGYWRNSYEAAEHIRHFGCAEHPICWTLVGYASGFITRTFGKPALVKETHCIGKKDPYCYFVARTVEDWPEEERGDLKYYEAESLASELDRAYQEIYELNRSTLRSQEIREELSKLMLEGKSLQCMAEYLSSVTGKSIVIKRKNMEDVFEAAYIPEHRSHGQHHAMASCAVFELKAGNTLLGTMHVIGDGPLGLQERLIMEQAANVFTIQMFHQFSIARSTWKLKEDFLEEALNGRTDEATLRKRALILDIPLADIARVAAVKVQPQEEIESVWSLISLKYPKLDAFVRNDAIVIMQPREPASSKHALPDEPELLKTIGEKFRKAKIYIGSGRRVQTLSDLGKSYNDAVKIAEFLQFVSPGSNASASFEQLEPIMLLIGGTNQEELLSFCRRMIGKLVSHDMSCDSNLLPTLKTYLSCNSNLKQAAHKLHLSIAGLRYRLQRIEELCGIDLNDATQRFNCYLAIQIYYAMQMIGKNVLQ